MSAAFAASISGQAEQPGIQPGSSSSNAPQALLEHRPVEPQQSPEPPMIALTVPKGTPLEIALEKELRIKGVGQPVRGRLVEPVYAFDKLVIPAGSEIRGSISNIQGVSAGVRTEAALNADFTPSRKVGIEFNKILLPAGRDLTIQTKVTPGSGQPLDFVSSPGSNRKNAISREVASRTQDAKQLARNEWNIAIHEVKSAGKLHRLVRYAMGQLPVHRQYIPSGSIYFAELQSPLDFGSEPLTLQMARSIGDLSAAGGVVHARLEMAVTSASNRKGDVVDAMITRPLFENGHLIVPEGSVLEGSVVQVRPARRLNKNGQLRVAFHELRLPDGVPRTIEANLESVQAGKSANVKLDSEGGARATTPNTRYLSTAVEIGLAGLAARGDPDAKTADPTGTTGSRIAGGVGGYKLVGALLGAFVQSRAFSYSMGAYGAGMSVYAHFIARGRDVVFPKDTAMLIGLGVHDTSPQATSQQPARSVSAH